MPEGARAQQGRTLPTPPDTLSTPPPLSAPHGSGIPCSDPHRDTPRAQGHSRILLLRTVIFVINFYPGTPGSGSVLRMSPA